MSLEDFRDNEMVQDAVVRNFTLIGEATRYIPEEVEARYPEIPWERMRGMRNLIVHDYAGIDYEIIWETVQMDLLPLVSQLQDILEREG